MMLFNRFFSILACLSIVDLVAEPSYGAGRGKKAKSQTDALNELPASAKANGGMASAPAGAKTPTEALNTLPAAKAVAVNIAAKASSGKAVSTSAKKPTEALNTLPAAKAVAVNIAAKASGGKAVSTSAKKQTEDLNASPAVAKGEKASPAPAKPAAKPADADKAGKTKQTAKGDKDKPVDINLVKKSALNGSFLFAALESAMKHNKEILAQQSEIKRVNESRVAASSPFRPSVSADARYSNGSTTDWGRVRSKQEEEQEKARADARKQQGLEPEPKLPDEIKSKSSVTSGSIRIEQNIFRGGADLAGLKENELQIKARWSAFEAVKQKVIREICFLYCELVSKEKEVAELKSLLTLREESVKVAKEVQAAGNAKPADYAQAVAGRAEVEAKIAMAEAEYERYKAAFKDLTGIEMPARLNNMPDGLLDESVSLAQCMDLAAKYNPDIMAENDKLEAARAALRKPNGKMLPSINLSASLDRSHDGGKKDERARHEPDHSGYTVGVSAMLPLYDGGVARSEVRQSSEAVVQITIEREKKISDIKTELVAAWGTMIAAKRSLESAERAVESREIALRATKDERNAGIKIMQDELLAQQDLYSAKVARTNAKKEVLKAQCAILALTGQLCALRLGLRDCTFDYRAHFAGVRRRF
jgi:outer membrane protein